MADLSGPVRASERIPTLDIVRGFALLGILIMNLPGFAASYFAEADGSHLWAGALDQRAEQIRDMLFSGKFNSLFSLLFGIGFTIQLGRMLERDPVHGMTLYVRGCWCCWRSRWCIAWWSGPATCCTSVTSHGGQNLNVTPACAFTNTGSKRTGDKPASSSSKRSEPFTAWKRNSYSRK
jgi:hypothetical protein